MSKFSHILRGRRAAPLTGVAAAAVAALAVAAPGAGAQVVTNDCFVCVRCTSPDGSEGHRVTNTRVPRGGFVGLTIPELLECGPGPCSNPQDPDVNHQVCVRPRTASFSVNALNAAARGGNVARLVAQVEAGGAAVEFNAARQALQVIGCTGAVVAHIPLGRAQLVALQGRAAPAAAPVRVAAL